MAQLQWTVPNIGGATYQVGLYHGEQSGHLVVYVNNKVTLIEFGVTQSKDFSFFLEQELFELSIVKRGAIYDYHFRHNEDLDTPHNMQRRTQERYNYLNRWVAGGLVLLMVLILVAVFRQVGSEQEQVNLSLANGAGEETVGRVIQVDNAWLIQFVADNKVVKEPLPSTDTLHPFGFPLTSGDEFILRYHPEDPTLLRVQWEKTLVDQLTLYEELSRARHAAANPQLAPRQVTCQLKIVYADQGLRGLALFYHQNDHFSDSLNRAAYLRYIRKPEVEAKLRECL